MVMASWKAWDLQMQAVSFKAHPAEPRAAAAASRCLGMVLESIALGPARRVTTYSTRWESTQLAGVDLGPSENEARDERHDEGCAAHFDGLLACLVSCSKQ